jgi:hypothetical protein
LTLLFRIDLFYLLGVPCQDYFDPFLTIFGETLVLQLQKEKRTSDFPFFFI